MIFALLMLTHTNYHLTKFRPKSLQFSPCSVGVFDKRKWISSRCSSVNWRDGEILIHLSGIVAQIVPSEFSANSTSSGIDSASFLILFTYFFLWSERVAVFSSVKNSITLSCSSFNCFTS